MNETVVVEEPTIVVEAPTQRLAFDKDIDESEIPQFLKKDKKKKARNPEPEEEEATVTLEPLIEPVSDAAEAALQSLAEMTIEQLKQQQAEIDRKIQEKQTAERQAVIDQITQVVKDYNIPVEELVEALGGMKIRRKGVKAKPKYKDPASGTTWSGRGKEPAWIKGVTDRSPFEI